MAPREQRPRVEAPQQGEREVPGRAPRCLSFVSPCGYFLLVQGPIQSLQVVYLLSRRLSANIWICFG